MARLRNTLDDLTGGNSPEKLAERYANASSDTVSDDLYSLAGKSGRNTLKASNKRLILEKRALQIMAPAIGAQVPSLEGSNIIRPEGGPLRKLLIAYWNKTHPRSPISLTSQPSQDYWMALHILLKQQWYTQEVRTNLGLAKLRIPVEKKKEVIVKEVIVKEENVIEELPKEKDAPPEQKKIEPVAEIAAKEIVTKEVVEKKVAAVPSSKQAFLEQLKPHIIREEGFRNKAYHDVGKIWAIGYGFTTIGGKAVRKGDYMSRQEADKELEKQIEKYQNRRKHITVPLSTNQEVALTSAEYNLGGEIRAGTGKPIIDGINSGDLASAAATLKNHNKMRVPIYSGRWAFKKKTGKTKLVAAGGLTKRRNAEAQLLLQGVDNQNSLVA